MSSYQVDNVFMSKISTTISFSVTCVPLIVTSIAKNSSDYTLKI